MSEAAQLNRDQVKDYLKNLSLLDAAALVKELEEELGVSAAAPVAAVGVVATVTRSYSSKGSTGRALGVLGFPVLVGLFGVAVALGTVGRIWSGPASLLSHLDSWDTAVVGALFSVVVNNLPAASLLAARVPPRGDLRSTSCTGSRPISGSSPMPG